MESSKNCLQYLIPYDDKSHQWPQVFAIFVVSLGSFTCGVQFAWTSPSIVILTSNSSHINQITLEEASYLALIPPVAMIIISPFVGIMLDYIGRKKTVLLMTIPHFFSWVIIIFARRLYLLYMSRFLSGIGYAIFFTALPTYVGEISTPSVRGLWGNLITVSTFFGQLLVNIIGTFCDIQTTAIIFSCVPLVHIVLILFLMESPYFLLMKNREQEARSALQKLRWRENVDVELLLLKRDVQRQISEQGTLKELFTVRTNQRALLMCTVVRAVQQFSGLAAFAVYTQYMFNQAGGNLSGSTSAIVYSAVWTVSICFSSVAAGKFGRRPLMIFSCLGCCMILSIEATYFYIQVQTSTDLTNLTWLPLAGMIIYILVSSTGLGVIPNLLLGEMFSANIKGKALCFTNICFAIYMVIVPKIFQILSEKVGMYVPFYFFSFCCLAGSIFSYYCLPETKGQTLEEIQQLLKGSQTDRKRLTTHC